MTRADYKSVIEPTLYLALTDDGVAFARILDKIDPRYNGTALSAMCRYNAVQFCKMLHEWLKKLRQNINQMLNKKKKKKKHTSP